MLSNVNTYTKKNIQISCTRWKCPQNFEMNSDWEVAAAEESQEVKAQNDREARVPEAFYPHPTAIPPNPFVAEDAHLGHIDDAQVPVIPLTPLEEDKEEDKEEDESPMEAPPEATIGMQALDQPVDLIPGLDADATVAAAAAYRAMLKWKEQGNLIDSDLLVNILENPDIMKKHIIEDGFSEDAINEPSAMIKEGISSTTDVEPKKSCDVSGPSTSTGPQVISTVGLQNSNMDSDSITAVVATSMEMEVADSKIGEPSSPGSGSLIEINEPSSLPNHVGIAPFSWTPSVPFKMSGSNEAMINNLMNKLKGTLPSPRPQIPVPSFQVVPMVGTAGTGPSLRPQFPNPSLNLGPVQNFDPNLPSIIPRPSSFCVPQQSIGPNAPSMAMPAGTLPRHDTSSLHSVPKIVPQGVPAKDIDYLKSLIRKHGNGTETPETDHVEVGKLHNHQEVPVISVGPQLKFEKPRCKFFSGPGGCRNGVNCRFEHVLETLPNAGGLLLEAPDSKRMKLGG